MPKFLNGVLVEGTVDADAFVGDGSGLTGVAPYDAVDVKDHGATGDGSTDDTAAIAAAFAAASAADLGVFFPPGTYAAGALTVPAGVAIAGVGATLKLKPGVIGPGDIARLVSLGAGSSIGRMTLDGNKAQNAGPAGYGTAVVAIMDGADGASVRGCTIANGTYFGAFVHDSTEITIADNLFTGHTDAAIVAQLSPHRLQVVNNRISGCLNSGIKVDSGDAANLHAETDAVVIRNNWIDYRGVTVDNSVLQALAIELFCETAGDPGITGGVVSGNTVWGPLGASAPPIMGISLGGCSDLKCSTNSVYGPNILIGIETANALRPVVVGNTVEGADVGWSSSGISRNPIFAQNRVKGSVTYGGQLGGTTTEAIVEGNVFQDAGSDLLMLNNAGRNSLIVGNQFAIESSAPLAAINIAGVQAARTCIKQNTFLPVPGGAGTGGLTAIYLNGAVGITADGNFADASSPSGLAGIATAVAAFGGSGHVFARNAIRNAATGFLDTSTSPEYDDNRIYDTTTPYNLAGVPVRVNPIDILSGGGFAWTRQTWTFTPVAGQTGWYRLLTGANSMGGTVEIFGSYDGAYTNLRFDFNVDGFGVGGSIEQTRYAGYNGGAVSQARLGQDGGAVYLDINVSTATAPGPITVTYSGRSTDVLGSTYNPTAPGTTTATLAFGYGFRTTSGFIGDGSGLTGLAGGGAEYSATVGDGAAADSAVAHGHGPPDVSVTVRQAATPYATALVAWDATDADTVTLHFTAAPAAGQYRATIMAAGVSGGGGGGGTGTVTSVALTVPAGLTVAGSPVTTSGTLAISTTLSDLVKGTGTGFTSAVAGTDYLAPAGNGSGLTGLTKSQVGLGSVEDTALSTWAGGTSLTTLGTVAAGTWNGTAVADTYIASAATWNAKLSPTGNGSGLTGVVHNPEPAAVVFNDDVSVQGILTAGSDSQPSLASLQYVKAVIYNPTSYYVDALIVARAGAGYCGADFSLGSVNASDVTSIYYTFGFDITDVADATTRAFWVYDTPGGQYPFVVLNDTIAVGDLGGDRTLIPHLARFQVLNGTAAKKGLVVRGAATQTASLQEWQNNAGTALTSIKADGTIVVSAVTAPTAAAGQLYYDSARNGLGVGVGPTPMNVPLTGAVSVNTTPVTANAASSTSAQNLMGFAVPAGLLNVAGKTLRLFGAGVLSQNTTGTISLRVNLGAVTLLTWTTASITGGAGTANSPWNFDVLLSTATVGTSGTTEAHGCWNLKPTTGGGSVTSYIDGNTAASSAINLTTAQTLQVTVTYSANGSGANANACTQRLFHVEMSN